MEFIQLHHVAYFGSPINPLDIRKVVTEKNEILLAGLGSFKDIYFVFPTLLLCYSFSGLLYWHLSPKSFKITFSFVIFLFIIADRPIEAYKHGEMRSFFPSPVRHSVHNSINAFSYLFSRKETRKFKLEYSPYEVIRKNHGKAQNIILIMGESCRYDHMSLFGYPRKTTPFLDSLKNNPSFAYTPGISGGVLTAVSLPVFMNLMREPGHMELLEAKTVNLFKMARENGYKTFWVSVQESQLLSLIGSQYLDKFVTVDSLNVTQCAAMRDEALVEFAKELPLGEKNFIVMHLRCLHSPYETNYCRRKEEFSIYPHDQGDRSERTINAYDNAMTYHDMVIKDIVGFFKDKFGSQDRNYVLFTSDHGELLGEHGLFGHAHLNLECALVPFWIYTSSSNLSAVQHHLKNYFITHYDIGIMIADLLGYNVKNPNIKNENKNEYFVHGNNIFDDNSFLKYNATRNGPVAEKIQQVSSLEKK